MLSQGEEPHQKIKFEDLLHFDLAFTIKDFVSMLECWFLRVLFLLPMNCGDFDLLSGVAFSPSVEQLLCSLQFT